MSMCTMKFDKNKREFDISRLPEVVLDIIIDAMWDKPDLRWVSELLADEEAEALAEAGVIVAD